MFELFLAILFLAGALVVWKFKPIRQSRREEDPETHRTRYVSVPTSHNKLVTLAATGLALLLFLSGATFIADADRVYVVQWPNGSLFVHSDPGIKFAMFGRVTSYDRVVAVGTAAFVGERMGAATSGESTDDAIEDEVSAKVLTLQIAPPLVRFTDAAKANAYCIARVGLPTDREGLLLVHKEFGSSTALANNLIAGGMRASAVASARLMSIQDYITKLGSDYETYFADMLEGGLYQTEVVKTITKTPGPEEAKATKVEGEEVKVADKDKSAAKEEDESIVEIVEPIRDASGAILRQGKNDFKRYKLRLITARITYMHPNKRTREQIAAQRDTDANAALAENRIRTALLEAQAEEAEGQKRVAEVRADELAKQTQATIAAETAKQKQVIESQRKVEQAELAKKEQKALLAAAGDEAKRIKVLADARAYEKAKIIKADNALEQKLAAWKEAQQFWAEAYSKRAVPNTIIGGAEGGVNTDATVFQQMLNAMLAKDLAFDPGMKAGS